MKTDNANHTIALSSRTDPADVLRHALRDAIQSGKLAPGDRLPTERHLSEEYGIGRSVVRRVLGQLRAQGLIVQTVGSGTYVAEPALPAEIREPVSTSVSPAHLMDARFLLEPAIVDLVIRNATSADLRRMEECCDRAETAQSFEEFEHWDGMLHKVIADATHNSFFTAVFALMNQVREQGEWGLLKKKSLTPERRGQYQSEHRSLVRALRERDAEQAKSLATAHLLTVRRNLLGY
jgi:DNA-binding FadR family transcriptional regulator